MPYINQEARRAFNDLANDLADNIETEGDLNYVITRICQVWEINQPRRSYSVLNSIVGVLECAKQEFYRQIVSPYEDIKQKENGDIFDDHGNTDAPRDLGEVTSDWLAATDRAARTIESGLGIVRAPGAGGAR
jgi:hypothetical protein